MTRAKETDYGGETLSNRTRAKQLSMLTGSQRKQQALTPAPTSPFPTELTAESSLALALSWFGDELAGRDYAGHIRGNYLTGLQRLRSFPTPRSALQKRPGLSDPGWLDAKEVLAQLAAQPV